MKKSTKIIRLSVTLLLLIAMLLTPMSPIFAVIIDGSGGADLTAADIVSEDASKREQFSRHFLTGDGTYFAVSYAEQVNYQDEDGNWIAVDNSLSTNVLTGEKTTRNDKFKVKFANKANKDDLVSIKTKEYDVSFGITVSEDGENYLALNKVKGTESASNTSAEPKTTQEATSLGKAVSGITYFDAFSDYLDVRYSVAHEKVKEDIILERKSGFNSYKVTYNVKEKDALATLNDDGSITFTSPAGAVLFTVGVPVMYDSEGKASSDISVSMVQTKKTVEITYTPNSDWLNAEDRVYPVTIDPEVAASKYNTNITDFSCYCCFEFDSINFSNPTLWMGMDYNVYIRFGSVATLPEGANYLDSYLMFYGNNMNDLTECSMAISSITEYWDEDSFGYGEGQFSEYNYIDSTLPITVPHININTDGDMNNIKIPLGSFYSNYSEYTVFYSDSDGFILNMSFDNDFRACSSECSSLYCSPRLVVRYGTNSDETPVTFDNAVLISVQNYHNFDDDPFNNYDFNAYSGEVINAINGRINYINYNLDLYDDDDIINLLDEVGVVIISSHGAMDSILLQNDANGQTLTLDDLNSYSELDLSHIKLLVLLSCSTAYIDYNHSNTYDCNNSNSVITSSDWGSNGPRNIFEKFVSLGVQTVIGFNDSIDAYKSDVFVAELFYYLYDYHPGNTNVDSTAGYSVRDVIQDLKAKNVTYSSIFNNLVIGGTDETVLYEGDDSE